MDGGKSHVYKINTKDLDTIWTSPLCAFNLGKGLINKNILYVGTFRFASKLNLENGKFIWKREDLYDAYNFNSYREIKLKGDTLLFIDSTYLYGKAVFKQKLFLKENDGSFLDEIVGKGIKKY